MLRKEIKHDFVFFSTIVSEYLISRYQNLIFIERKIVTYSYSVVG